MSDKVFEYYIHENPHKASEFWITSSLKAEGIKYKVWGQFDIYLILYENTLVGGPTDCLVDVGSARFGQLTALVLQGEARIITVEQQRRFGSE
jgi:hypothetical protein